MRLGDTVHVTIGVPDLAASLAFYGQIGFGITEQADEPYPWAILSDGQLVLGLHQDGLVYRGLTYFAPDMGDRVEALAALGLEFVARREDQGRFIQAIFVGADNLAISLIAYGGHDHEPPLSQPNPRLKTFGEYSLGVTDLEASIAYWQQLGFELAHRDKAPYPWAILRDGLMILGLHQQTEFSGPAITYFAPDMPARIQGLAEAGVPLVREFANAEGIIAGAKLVAPDGQEILLFTADM